MPKQLPALLVMCLLFASIAASAADPSFYVRRSTWEETMRASREALMQQEAQRKAALEARVAADPALGRFAPLEEAVNFGDEPRLVRVRVAGLKELYVGAVSLGGKRTVGQYCEPRLIDANGKATRVALSKPPVVATHGPGTFLPSSHRSWQTVSVDGQELQRGFVVDRGEVALQLDGKYEWFEAWIAAIKGPKTEQVRFTADYRSRYRLANRGNADRSRLWELVQRDFGTAELKQGRAVEDPHEIWQRDWRPIWRR